jgi:hypothetical protein
MIPLPNEMVVCLKRAEGNAVPWKAIAWSAVVFIGVGAIGVMLERIIESITSRLDAIKEQLKIINEELRRR